MVGFGVFIPALALLYVINKRVKGKVGGRRGRDVVAILTMLIAVAAGCGLVYTFVAPLVAGLIGLPAHFNYWLGLGVSVGAVLLFVGIATADIVVDRTADGGAQFAGIITPTLLVLVAGGVMGHTGSDAVKTVNTEMTAIVKQIGAK